MENLEKGEPGQAFRPASDAQRNMFMGVWCCGCERDAPMNSGKRFEECRPHEVCPLLRQVYAGISWPREWRFDRNGCATCSAYVPKGEAAAPLNGDTATLDLFR